MSGSADQQIDVGGGDIPVTVEDVKLFETPAEGGSPPSGGGSDRSSSVDVKPRIEPTRVADDGSEDPRFSQSQNRQRRERQRQARERSEQRIAELEARVARAEGLVAQGRAHTIGAAAEGLDAQFAQVRGRFQAAERRYAAAISNSDGPAATQAMADRDQALEEARAIEARRNQVAAAAQEMQRQPAPRPQPQHVQPDIPPEVIDHGTTFMKDHPWYDLNGGDRDSKLVSMIDVRLTSQGYDPRTPDYWEELREQVKESLPHRFATDKATSTGRRGPPVSGPGGATPRGGAPDPLAAPRIEAMKQAGYWDDPEQRARMIKHYREYDAQQAGAR